MVSEAKIRSERFEERDEFFEQNGSVWMKLTKEAAIAVVEQCEAENRAVSIVEGGIWQDPGFEARLDAIWHSGFDKKPVGQSLSENNAAALGFLAAEMPAECDTAIITVFKD